ncbi:uncharacterized protein LOC117648176 isoform X2 [Thrips palmi]|uniref:Uncharacterized protein LOC117648176 isoform X2 n=1 Tax=Thrips palmi TaxID=161013 RepID=A0A6P8Z839_THRPL|nr:uncharacterized protein LOC117648176 isoform X2 [Thrips palmi]
MRKFQIISAFFPGRAGLSSSRPAKVKSTAGFDAVRSAGIGPPRSGKYSKYGWYGNVPFDASQLQHLLQSMSLTCFPGEESDAASSDDSSDDSSDESVVEAEAATPKCDSEEGAAGSVMEPGVTIEYEHPNHAEFVAAVKQAPRIKKLQLQQLHRSDDFVARWKPDKHIEAVLKALEEGPSHVEELEVYDAHWAQCYEYSDRFVELLKKYSGTLRYLSITNRALVQPNRKNKKQTVMKVVSRMPRLEHLQLVFIDHNLYFYTYRGQFAKASSAACFPALKNLEVHLRFEWYEQQFCYATLPLRDRYMEDYKYTTLTGGHKEEFQEPMLEDILRNKKDIISYLDMSVFGPTTYRLPIIDCFADLTELRGIGVRAEYVEVTAKMVHLEKINVLFHETSKEKAAAAAAFIRGGGAAVWSRVKTLNVVPTRYRDGRHPACPVRTHWRCALRAAAEQCSELRRLEVAGGDWNADTISTFLRNNAQTLEEVQLTDFEATDEHLELLLAVPTLRSAKLKRPPPKASATKKTRRGKSKRAALKADAAKDAAAVPPSELEKRGVAVEWL